MKKRNFEVEREKNNRKVSISVVVELEKKIGGGQRVTMDEKYLFQQLRKKNSHLQTLVALLSLFLFFLNSEKFPPR